MKFPPIYIIKMPGSTRNPLLIESLKKLDLDYEIQDAIVGKNLTPDEIKKFVNLRACKARLGYNINKSLIGCALSHNEIYRKALSNNYEWVLIFEEDAILKDFDYDHILEIINKNPPIPTVIQLFSRSSRLMEPKSSLKLQDGRREIFNFKPRLVGSGASAYLINKPALKVTQDKGLIGGPPDWPDWSHKVQFKGVYPWMTSESDANSTIPVVKVSKFNYIKRRVYQISFIHFLIYKREYPNFKIYLKEELVPFYFYLKWRLSGAKYYNDDMNGPQIII